jgi:hypothetical protein
VTRTRDRFYFFWLLATLLVVFGPALAQEGGQKAAESTEKTTKEKLAAPEKASGKPELPFLIQLLESHIRFEANGDSRKEVHTIVKINNILGAHEFARLTFDYNRAFQQVEIPLVRISHANGGTSELLPSAVVDAPNPAVEKFPAYQDVRVKSVRILGLQEGDTIEYRVITTTTKHPLAPDFWLEHTFDRSGQVLEERYEIDLPGMRTFQISISPNAPAKSIDTSGEAVEKRRIYRWHVFAPKKIENEFTPLTSPDLLLTTYASWTELAKRLDSYNGKPSSISDRVNEKTKELAGSISDGSLKMAAYYHFVATKIRTVELPLETVGFQSRDSGDVLSSGYGTLPDKFALLQKLSSASVGGVRPVFAGDHDGLPDELPLPSHLVNMLAAVSIAPAVIPDSQGQMPVCADCEEETWLDIGLDVAPFGVVRPELRGKMGLLIGRLAGIWEREENGWRRIPDLLPFPEKQTVDVSASIASSGDLSAKVKYIMRGDNELLLRLAFHQTAKDKWKDVANLLAISDGFRGQVTSVNVSDPTETKDPFTVEYEITQAKFVDWAKKPVRIPVLLPQIGLPDPPAKTPLGQAAPKIHLGIPLEVETHLALRFPAGTVVQPPAGTTVARDYATFRAKYSAVRNTLMASRSVYFIKREIPGDEAMDYNAFVHAVQSDQAQSIALVRETLEEKK